MMTPAEEFLRDFHDRNPAAASELAERGTVDGRTVYEVFADQVGRARQVLDLGCGDGALLSVLAGRGAEKLAGIDLSGKQVEAARGRTGLAEADLRPGRAQELPFEDDSYDAVVSFMALMLMSDIEQVIAETVRVLRPRGVFAIGVGGGGTGALEVFPKVARPLFAVVAETRQVPASGDPRSRTREGLDGLLGPAGFAPVEWHEMTVDLSGPPDEVWQTCQDTYYQVEALDENQLKGLQTAFKVATRPLVADDGTLAAGARINVATTRLAEA
ncbi:class I SAM-dependent methyltransferase [Amycolatopsis benzoatilytica]|uniref:class I SAM-dependent methyltransferase n=1 Tax=Amycolatopsis benzoatilytica TaxID=346045 RepID=UPI000365EA95|nr:class I SAM-dependent methyltransferase [Amycolatopsis benzoatilytica]